MIRASSMQGVFMMILVTAVLGNWAVIELVTFLFSFVSIN